MLPSTVFTHRNGAHRAACLPEPVTIGKWAQPAFSTAGQQDRPSPTTVLPGARSRLAILSTSFLRKARNDAQPQPSRPPVERGLHRGHDRRLAGGAPPAL